MVNRSGHTHPVPTLQVRRELIADIPETRYSTGAAEAAQQMADRFFRLSSRLEDNLDTQVALEATREGGVAGLDPNFRPGTDATIRGRAFNAAAMRSYVGRLEIDVRRRAEEIFREHKENPGALAEALAGLRQGYSTSLADFPDMVPAFEQVFDRVQLAYMSQAAANAERIVMDAARATTMELLDQKRRDLERVAFTAGDSEQISAAIAGELAGIRALLLENGPRGAFTFAGEEFEADPTRSGAFTVEQIASILMQTEELAAEARVLGSFRQLRGPAAQQAYLDRFVASFGAGEGAAADLSLAQVERLASAMRAEIARGRAQANAAASAVRDRIRTAGDLMSRGYVIPDEEMSSLRAQAAATGDEALVAALDSAAHMSALQQEIRVLPPAQLQGIINQRITAINEAGRVASPGEVAEIELMQDVLSSMQSRLRSDPLSWAIDTGTVAAEPLVLTGEGALASMQARAAGAHAVQDYYGLDEAPFFTSAERSALVAAVKRMSADELTALGSSIAAGFGADAPAVLAQLAPDLPGFAHAAALALDGPAQAAIAATANEGATLRRDGTDFVPSSNPDFAMLVDDVLKDVFVASPRTRSAVIATAENIYNAEIARTARPSEPDIDLWESALRRAAGGVPDPAGRGRIIGGPLETDYGTVIPPEPVTAREFERTLEQLTDADLWHGSVGAGPPVYRRPKPDGSGWEDVGVMTAEELLDDGQLEQRGDGIYAINMGTASRPEYVGGTGPGGVYLLDLGRLWPTLRARLESD